MKELVSTETKPISRRQFYKKPKAEKGSKAFDSTKTQPISVGNLRQEIKKLSPEEQQKKDAKDALEEALPGLLELTEENKLEKIFPSLFKRIQKIISEEKGELNSQERKYKKSKIRKDRESVIWVQQKKGLLEASPIKYFEEKVRESEEDFNYLSSEDYSGSEEEREKKKDETTRMIVQFKDVIEALEKKLKPQSTDNPSANLPPVEAENVGPVEQTPTPDIATPEIHAEAVVAEPAKEKIPDIEFTPGFVKDILTNAKSKIPIQDLSINKEYFEEVSGTGNKTIDRFWLVNGNQVIPDLTPMLNPDRLRSICGHYFNIVGNHTGGDLFIHQPAIVKNIEGGFKLIQKGIVSADTYKAVKKAPETKVEKNPVVETPTPEPEVASPVVLPTPEIPAEVVEPAPDTQAAEKEARIKRIEALKQKEQELEETLRLLMEQVEALPDDEIEETKSVEVLELERVIAELQTSIEKKRKEKESTWGIRKFKHNRLESEIKTLQEKLAMKNEILSGYLLREKEKAQRKLVGRNSKK